jgi:hypothetical protein
MPATYKWELNLGVNNAAADSKSFQIQLHAFDMSISNEPILFVEISKENYPKAAW